MYLDINTEVFLTVFVSKFLVEINNHLLRTVPIGRLTNFSYKENFLIPPFIPFFLSVTKNKL